VLKTDGRIEEIILHYFSVGGIASGSDYFWVDRASRALYSEVDVAYANHEQSIAQCNAFPRRTLAHSMAATPRPSSSRLRPVESD